MTKPIIFASLGLSLVPATASAQFVRPSTAPAEAVAPTPEAVFSFEIGRAVVDHDNGASSIYAVEATQNYRSKTTGAKVRLSVVEKSAGGTQTHVLTINTGKYKTVAQLVETVADIFRKYLNGVTPVQEIGKIGDVAHGGEIHFVAEPQGFLRYSWLTPGEPTQSTRLKATDVQVLLGILTHPKAD